MSSHLALLLQKTKDFFWGVVVLDVDVHSWFMNRIQSS